MNPYIKRRLELIADELQASGDRNDLAMAGIICAALSAYLVGAADELLPSLIPHCKQLIDHAEEKRAAEARGS